MAHMVVPMPTLLLGRWILPPETEHEFVSTIALMQQGLQRKRSHRGAENMGLRRRLTLNLLAQDRDPEGGVQGPSAGCLGSRLPSPTIGSE